MFPNPQNNDRPSIALLSGLSAYLIWGGVGFYFRIITVNFGVNSFTLLANRVIWSLAFLMIVLACRRDLRSLVAAIKTPNLIGPLAISSVLIGINWIVFIYAAATGRLLQASLGYFLTPLLSVLLGVVLLREKLRLGQLTAIVIAAVGIAPMVYLRLGSVWIPISLMVSFSLYGLMRKRIVIGPVVGLAVETALLFPLAIAFIALYPLARPTAIAPTAYALLIAAGVITAIPLLLFAYAARRLKLITIGLLQYTSPTVQFVIACLFAGESVSGLELGAFIAIWIGLIIFSIDSVIGYRNRERSAIAAVAESPAGAIATSLPSRA